MDRAHHISRSPTYRSWENMLQRCTNPNHPQFVRYGGRGITVCDRWFLFANFCEDMGERPAGRTLDRTNNDGNYEPTNCRWATPKEQTANRHPHPQTKLAPSQRIEMRELWVQGVSKYRLAKKFGVSPTTAYRVATKETYATDGKPL